ncbi:MAG: helix-turn-helix domain-containing protein [Acidobacteria bacterium]|nr:helix-turn-helix domain-containing protein [Acidobacteriota bacterium]NIM60421.1 helix-turn-helix domain-containing protein [Acidobacteriota bacterium]NIO58596.1 helix-turn-helix domain-containing protein [Acidobacteriota bacterium]NIQ29648.1 helix-turn-helix domain-containing protein [Acidobacteriota bacterium]NIQ84365.1 helix-turn-helix domain-containing protein [Acidobacteriota bacterium]
MAERASVAFGRYLKILRGRRRLSLDRVAKLSETSARPIDKGTLSRFERGQQRLALSTVIPISHIYAVPVEVLVERLELDTELERLGAPETEDKTPAELRRLGSDALLQRNRRWDAFACFRDAYQRLELDGGDDAAVAQLNLASVARSLGKNRLALHELTDLEQFGRIGERLHAIVLDRISHCHRGQGDLTLAEYYADAAIDEARQTGEGRILSVAQLTRGIVAIDRADPGQSVRYLRQAFRTHREATGDDLSLLSDPGFEANLLLHLSEAFTNSGFYEKAGYAARSAKKLGARVGLPGPQAYSELALGELDERAGRDERAIQRWRRSAELAESMNNRRLGFCAEFYVFRQALNRGNTALARASRRRLERLTPWVPEHFPLLRELQELAPMRRSVTPSTGEPAHRGRSRRNPSNRERLTK